MKKLCLLFCFMCVSLYSFGQITVMGEFRSYKKIATVRASYSYVYQTESGYEFVSRTSNQFDNDFHFLLGEDKESAIQSAKDLIGLLENKDFENAIISNKNDKCVISKMSMLGANYLLLADNKHAGSCNITKKELDKIIQKLNSITE